MGTDTIANISASDISDLQDDVNELKNKLNALIAEFNKCSDDTTTNKAKIDDLISKVSGGYTATQTTGGGANTDSILERLSNLDTDFSALSTHYDGHLDNHPGSSSGNGGRGGFRDDGGAQSGRAIDLNALTGAGADTSVNASTASVNGVYGAASSSVVTLGDKGEIKVRKLARQTLNRLRK